MNRNKGVGFLIICLTLFLSFLPGGSPGKERGAKGAGKNLISDKGFGFASNRAPIYIDSDSFEADQKKNMAVYKGNVVAKQEDTVLYAQTLTILYDANTKRLKEIIAAGNVKVVQLNRRFSGKKATFDQGKNQVVLEWRCRRPGRGKCHQRGPDYLLRR